MPIKGAAMKFSFFLFLYLVLIGISRPGIAQETEANRLLKEAEESRYTNPQKSLKLYNYLLKTPQMQLFLHYRN